MGQSIKTIEKHRSLPSFTSKFEIKVPASDQQRNTMNFLTNCKTGGFPQKIDCIIQGRHFQELKCLLSSSNSRRITSTQKIRVNFVDSVLRAQTRTFTTFNNFEVLNEIKQAYHRKRRDLSIGQVTLRQNKACPHKTTITSNKLEH